MILMTPLQPGIASVDVANRHAPIKRLKTKGALKPWITNDLKELMAERDYAFIKLRKDRVANNNGIVIAS